MYRAVRRATGRRSRLPRGATAGSGQRGSLATGNWQRAFAIVVAVAAALLATAACSASGAYHAVAPAIARDGEEGTGSGVQGRVTVGPTCPVERIGSPCPDRPYQTTVVALDASGNEVARTASGPDGAFELELEPRSYVLTELVPGVFPRPSRTPVAVQAGRYTQVTLRLDSGIR